MVDAPNPRPTAPTWRSQAIRVAGVLALPIALPIAFFAGMFGARSKATPAEFEAMLTTLIEHGPEFRAVYDELGSVPIDDRRLEALREEMFAIGDPPWDDDHIETLRALRERVRVMIVSDRAGE